MPARREQQNALREGRETDACRRRGVRAAGPGWAGEVPGAGRNRFAALAAARAMVRMSSSTTTGRPPHGPGPGGTKPAEGAVPPREVRARTRKVAAWGVPDRLQPGSGWLALTWAAARAPAEGSAVHGAHPSGCCGLGLAWHAAAVQYGRTRPDGVRVSIQLHHGSGRRGWRRIRICFILLTSSRCLISMRGSGTQASPLALRSGPVLRAAAPVMPPRRSVSPVFPYFYARIRGISRHTGEKQTKQKRNTVKRKTGPRRGQGQRPALNPRRPACACCVSRRDSLAKPARRPWCRVRQRIPRRSRRGFPHFVPLSPCGRCGSSTGP